MIDIIIPAYNAHKCIENALNSILMQTITNKIKVYIINDGSEKDYKEIINKYNKYLNITEYDLKSNKGPGYARQYGIDHTTSKYIIFIDSDDIFYTNTSIESLYKTIENEKSDIVISNFYEETNNGLILHNEKDIWLHGKIYKRTFLKNNNITFNNSYSNEDTGFNKLVFLNDLTYTTLDEITYIWKNNPDSITRKNNCEFNYIGLKGFVENITNSIKKYEKNNNINKERIANLSYETILEIYYNYIEYKNHNKRDILIWLKDIYKIYLKYKKYLTNENKDQINQKIIIKSIEITDNNKLINNTLSFDKFIKSIEI